MEFYCNKYRTYRKQQKLSMEELAGKIGISRRTLWSWEKGERSPSKEKIRLIAKGLNISVDLISNLPKEHPTSEKLSNISNTKSSNIDFFHDEHDPDKAFFDLLNRINHYRNDLKKSTSIIKGLLSSMNAIFYVKDINHNYIAANELFKSLTNVADGIKIPGKKDEFFFSKEEAKVNTKEDSKVILTGECVLNREGFIPGSRKKKWGLISKLPIFDKEKKITGIVGTFVDITERRNNERYRRHLEAAINKIDAAIWLGSEITDSHNHRELHIDFFNNTAKEKYGITTEQASKVKGKCCGGCLLDKNHGCNILESTSFPVTHEHYFNSAAGEKIIFEEKIFKYDNSKYIGIINDVTLQKHYNNMLQLLEININSLNDGLVIRDIDTGEFLYVNSGMKTIFNYETDSFYKGGWEFWINNCVHPDYQQQEGEFNRSKQWPSVHRTIKAFTANGKERWININSSFKVYMNKKCLISIFRDITARKTTDDISNILDNISDTVSICQKDTHKILYMSKAIEDVFGYPKTFFQSKNIYDALTLCIHKDDVDKQINYYNINTIPKNRTYRIEHPKKGLRVIESRTTEVEYMGKECFLMICRDITNGLK